MAEAASCVTSVWSKTGQHICWRYFPGWRGISVPRFVTGWPVMSVRFAVCLSFQDSPYISQGD